MATVPFTEDIAPLLESMDGIPVDDTVPFSDAFKKIMEEHEGNPWGPQATEASKLATRLHFAGWSRQELESVGLKPKDAENFRSKFKLTLPRAGRPRAKSAPQEQKASHCTAKPVVDPIEAIRIKCALLKDRIECNQEVIRECHKAIEEARTELKKQEEALAVLSS
ncbi:hypothetical protein [Pseudomonas sp.]|uniref:hypothetical protein n=1 Tax=Pseudomonas sp. TaxID=306 RepID=UPI0037CBAAC9